MENNKNELQKELCKMGDPNYELVMIGQERLNEMNNDLHILKNEKAELLVLLNKYDNKLLESSKSQEKLTLKVNELEQQVTLLKNDTLKSNTELSVKLNKYDNDINKLLESSKSQEKITLKVNQLEQQQIKCNNDITKLLESSKSQEKLTLKVNELEQQITLIKNDIVKINKDIADTLYVARAGYFKRY